MKRPINGTLIDLSSFDLIDLISLILDLWQKD